MRIIAGLYGGRIIKAPSGYKTHPMSEKMRGALFNSINNFDGKDVWDAFAGSGALGLEALSRGATSVVATDSDRAAYGVLKDNIQKLKAENIKAIKAPAKGWSENNVDKKFDIILCDPPYNNLQLSTVFALKSHLKPNGLMVLSYPGREPIPTADGVVVVDNRNYGDGSLAYYQLK
jgi:16S rRNA (guanine966-N2)-methyltransferase